MSAPSARCPPQPTVLALARDATKVARLRAAFGNALHPCDTPLKLLKASREPGIELVVVEVRDPRGQALATTVAAIRASRQGAPVHVYADRSVDCMRGLMPLARAGARGVIVRDVDDDAVSLRRLLEHGSLSLAVESMTAALQHVVPARHLPLVLLCMEHVVDPLDANAFARRLGVSRRTLSAWAARTGARGIRSLTSKCRVLTAIELLRDSGRSVEYVAHTLQFASSAHLHNTIRRYAGCAPRDAVSTDLVTWCQRMLLPGAAPAGKAPASRGMADST